MMCGRGVPWGYGIDREETRQGGVPRPRAAAGQRAPPGVPDAINLNEMYPYNPEKAKQLLKELGYDEKNPLRFTILVG